MTSPIYESPRCTIYAGDCLGILPNLPPSDLLVTDPPYGIGFKSNFAKNHKEIKGDENTDVAIEALKKVVMKSGRHVYVFWSPKIENPDAEACKFQAWTELVWDKGIHGMGGGHCWGGSHEKILFAVKVPSAANRRSGKGKGAARLRRGSILRCQRTNSGQTRGHPTEKPVPLMRELVEASSRFGETVIDPFAGTGSTLVASILEGRKCVGIEINAKFVDEAIRRVRLAEAVANSVENL